MKFDLKALLILNLMIFMCSACDDPPPTDGDADADSDQFDADADHDDDADDTEDAESDSESPDADDTPLNCALLSERLQMPTPAWHGGENLAPPSGDQASDLLENMRQPWHAQLTQLTGWPTRSTIIIPLNGEATAVDAAGVSGFELRQGSDQFQELETEFTIELVDENQSVLIRPFLPFPDTAVEVIISLSSSAITGADPLPACGADQQPDPGYDAAAQSLPDGVESIFALRFPISQSSHVLPRLWQHYQENPALQVSSIESVATDSLGDASPPAEIAEHLQDNAAIGILELPDYRDENGVYSINDQGLPEEMGSTLPGFVVALPETGTPPYPFVLYQHGGTQSKLDIFQLAGPLAEAGFAIVAIDLPLHGDRAEDGGGTDMDIFDPNDPLLTRDNLRQGSADHLALLSGIDTLNVHLAKTLGVDDALDQNAMFYMGLSLGGITGSMTYSSGHDIQAAALFVAAADYTLIMLHGIFSMIVLDVLSRPDIEQAVILGFLEAFLDGADPGAYAMRMEDRSIAPRPLLLWQAKDDPIISAESNDYWGHVFGTSLVRPFDHEVSGMDVVDLPVSDNFVWQSGGDEATRVLVHAPMDEIPVTERHGGLVFQDYSQEMVAHCFRTLLDTGSCEVMDTGFSEH